MEIARIIDEKTIHVFDKSQFDWYAIRNCGQIFRDPDCVITEKSDKIVINATGEKNAEWLWNYFDLDTDYNEIKKSLFEFLQLTEPLEHGAGIRILRQPFIECVISFIISANNNIKRFSKTIASMCAEFGFKGAFPTLCELSGIKAEDFARLGCGYRAPYLVKAIVQLHAPDMRFESLCKLKNDDLRKKLVALFGVGRKVADCVMLFCFHRLDVAPVDTHIRRAIAQLGIEQSDVILNHKFAGVAQQYIFYYLQHLRKDFNS